MGAIGVRAAAARLLVVEDNAVLSLHLETTLEAAGFAVETAGSGQEALDVLKDRGLRFDLLITDIDLGLGPDGCAVALCARGHAPSLPIVFITAEQLDPSKLGPRCRLVRKPFRDKEILRAIEELLCDRAAAGP